ncbi:hypothetical protein [Streptomyces beijiangensis]|uniref:Secreted protein n=1 Tax=Streptomyces beijiangensis TaxID=163361 RepID=A0A939F7S1_9ACTN|nr:hypothetical protein [Streptomyces beijiangensis]MBO0512517.1 hypothetical protein [Streptomyces beijiangensis]
MRRIALAAAGATLALTAALAGCSAVDKAVDCVQTADAIASNVNNLQQAVTNAANDPTQADQALDDISKNLKSLGDKTDDADLSKSIDSLNTAVDNVRSSIKNGDNTPDISPVADAASELGKVCTS